MRKMNPNRDQTISIRVSAEEKEKIKGIAARKKESTSEYVLGAAMAGLERRTSREKRRAAQMVKNQEILNEIFELMKEDEAEGALYKKLMELKEGENVLWQCS